MEVTAHQNIERFISNGFEIKYLILSNSIDSKKIEFERYKTAAIDSEIEFHGIKEKSKFNKIFDELTLKNLTFLNYEMHKKNTTFEHILEDINYVFVPPIKGVLFFINYLAKYTEEKGIKSIFHTNDCISSYYLGTALRMLKGYEKKTLLGLSYLFRYQFIKFLEKKYLQRFDLCMVQTTREKLKLEMLLSSKKSLSPKIIVEANKPVKELLDYSYKPNGLNFLLMSHFIDNRAYSAIWFIKKVWRKVIKIYPDAHLHIYGALDIESKVYQSVKYEKNINFYGFSSSLTDAYRDIIISIVPIFQDNGSITRITDSLSAGVPCITSPQALSTIDEAQNLKHAIASKNSKKMLTDIINCLDNKEILTNLSKNGKELMLKKYKTKNDLNFLYG